MSSEHSPFDRPPNSLAHLLTGVFFLVILSGCYAPLRSPGIPARELPEHYRLPLRTIGEPLNFSHLTSPPGGIYRLGNGDILEITAPDLLGQGDVQPFRTQVLENGEVTLPRAGTVVVGGLSLSEARRLIVQVLGDGYLKKPSVTLTLVEYGTTNVVVMGAVRTPGVHTLRRDECDVAHALAAAGGFAETAGDVIEVHRRRLPSPPASYPVSAEASASPNVASPSALRVRNQHVTPASYPPALPRTRVNTSPPRSANPYNSYRTSAIDRPENSLVIRAQSPNLQRPAASRNIHQANWQGHTFSPGLESGVLRISLRDAACLQLAPDDVRLSSGDVVVVPPKQDEVFYVVGPLSEQNRVRFNVGDRDREIGNGFLLPENREIDVVTAVAMAGYIDPIESPTTVTVHRRDELGCPLLVRVDLIAARTDPRETILVQPGDIIYLNPDHWWYSRRLFDRVIDRALGTAVGRLLTN